MQQRFQGETTATLECERRIILQEGFFGRRETDKNKTNMQKIFKGGFPSIVFVCRFAEARSISVLCLMVKLRGRNKLSPVDGKEIKKKHLTIFALIKSSGFCTGAHFFLFLFVF